MSDAPTVEGTAQVQHPAAQPVRYGAGVPAPARDAERGARRALREQVARLERDLADTLIAAFPHEAVDVTVAARGRGPRLLDLGELEQLRDDLATKLRAARVEVERQGEEHAARRAAGADAPGPRQAQVRQALAPRPRRTGLWRLPGATAPGPRRHARRVVARQAQQWVSQTHRLTR